MFESRRQRLDVIQTLFGLFGCANWVGPDELQGKALDYYDQLQKGYELGLSRSAEWIFRLAMSMWDQTIKIEFGRFYVLDGRNRRVVFSLLACFADYEEQNARIEAWLKQWSHLRDA